MCLLCYPRPSLQRGNGASNAEVILRLSAILSELWGYKPGDLTSRSTRW
jgi:hypothetical protein